MVAWITVMVAFAILGIQPTKNIKAGKILSYKNMSEVLHAQISIIFQSRFNLV